MSIPPEYSPLSRGLEEVSQEWMTSFAPREVRYSAVSGLLEYATVSTPSFFRIKRAVLPTPPVAPLMITGRPLRSEFRSLSMLMAAVSPAVPSIMASFRLIPAGRATAQWAGTEIYSENPPLVFMPRS
ncbi:hypothetical protein D9M69_648720 [compost metagenome]